MRISTISTAWAREGLDHRVMMFRDKQPHIYKAMTQVIQNREQYIEIAEAGGFPAAGAVNEGTGIQYSDIQTPYYLKQPFTKRGLGFATSTETLERDLYGLFKKVMPLMARAVDQAIEIDIAGFMNLATAGPIITPDQVTLASTAHLNAQGFYSNILSTNAPLSEGALEQAVQEIQFQPDHQGFPMMITGPFDLWVPPQLMGLAHRLSGTTPNGQIPQSFNSDIDWAGGYIRRVIANPFFTNTTAWALVTADDSLMPFYYAESRKFTTREQEDIDHDVIKFAATQIWGKYPKDPRGFIYSAGQ